MSWERLRQLIDTSLSLEDVRTLCFDLYVDYDSLGGEGKAGKVRELIVRLRRTGRIPELIAYLIKVRPNISWNELRFDERVADLPPLGTPSTTTSNASIWRNWGDHPFIVIVGLIVGVIAIYSFVTGRQSLSNVDRTISTSTAAITVPTSTVAFSAEPTLDPRAAGLLAAAETATAEGTRLALTETVAAVANRAAAETATAEGMRLALTETVAAITLEPTPGSAVLFRDDFDGKGTVRWTVVSPGFTIKTEHLHGEPVFGKSAVLVNNAQGIDYTITTNIEGGNFWILFRSTLNSKGDEITQGYAFACGVHSCAWVKTLTNESIPISPEISRENFSADEFHDIKITVEESSFKVFVDNKLYSSVNDASFSTGGVGIAAVAVDVAYTNGFDMDFIEVSPVDK